jgi:hypothetical protein
LGKAAHLVDDESHLVGRIVNVLQPPCELQLDEVDLRVEVVGDTILHAIRLPGRACPCQPVSARIHVVSAHAPLT